MGILRQFQFLILDSLKCNIKAVLPQNRSTEEESSANLPTS